MRYQNLRQTECVLLLGHSRVMRRMALPARAEQHSLTEFEAESTGGEGRPRAIMFGWGLAPSREPRCPASVA